MKRVSILRPGEFGGIKCSKTEVKKMATRLNGKKVGVFEVIDGKVNFSRIGIASKFKWEENNQAVTCNIAIFDDVRLEEPMYIGGIFAGDVNPTTKAAKNINLLGVGISMPSQGRKNWFGD